MNHQLRIEVIIPLEGDAIARARAGGDLKIDVIKAKARSAKKEAA